MCGSNPAVLSKFKIFVGKFSTSFCSVTVSTVFDIMVSLAILFRMHYSYRVRQYFQLLGWFFLSALPNYCILFQYFEIPCLLFLLFCLLILRQKLDGKFISPVSGFLGTMPLPTSSNCLENIVAVGSFRSSTRILLVKCIYFTVHQNIKYFKQA